MPAEDLAFASIATLGERLRAGVLSPVLLTEGFLERIERLDPGLSSFVTATPERALAEARSAESEIAAGKWRGPLHGIPYALKDLIDTAEIRTTAGASVFKDRVPAADATVVTRLRDAGAILLGKLSMMELAGALGQTTARASINGACRNPWNRDRWAGGSSSGTAAAVAAGLVPFALGTEAIHSLIGPAGFCGAAALLPTYGIVSKRGVMAVAWSLDRVGVTARTAEDCATVLGAIAAVDPADRSSVPLPRNPGAQPITRAAVIELPGVAPEVRAAFETATATLRECGLTFESVRLPDLPMAAVARLIVHVETRAAFEDILRMGRQRELADPMHAKARPSDALAGPPTAFELVKAQRIRTLVQDALDEVFRGVDVLIAPSMPVEAPPIDEPLDALFTKVPDVLGYASSLGGLPVVSVACGFTAAGLPVSVRLVGRPFDDVRLAELAARFQSRTQWHLRRPPA